jgi:hypothetical protein
MTDEVDLYSLEYYEQMPEVIHKIEDIVVEEKTRPSSIKSIGATKKRSVKVKANSTVASTTASTVASTAVSSIAGTPKQDSNIDDSYYTDGLMIDPLADNIVVDHHTCLDSNETEIFDKYNRTMEDINQITKPKPTESNLKRAPRKQKVNNPAADNLLLPDKLYEYKRRPGGLNGGSTVNSLFPSLCSTTLTSAQCSELPSGIMTPVGGILTDGCHNDHNHDLPIQSLSDLMDDVCDGAMVELTNGMIDLSVDKVPEGIDPRQLISRLEYMKKAEDIGLYDRADNHNTNDDTNDGVDILDIDDDFLNSLLDDMTINGCADNTDETKLAEERQRFAAEYSYNLDNQLVDTISDLVPTTTTIVGNLGGLLFKERDLVAKLEPTESAVIIKCNGCKKVWAGYTEPVARIKSNRGRKPKPKKQKRLREKTTENCFDSQVTFLVRQRVTDASVLCQLETLPPDGYIEFKLKLFRKNVIQVTGVKQPLIDVANKCILIVIDMINAALDVKLEYTSLISTMDNYKAHIPLPHGKQLNLSAVKIVLVVDMLRDNDQLYLSAANERLSKSDKSDKTDKLDIQSHEAIADNHESINWELIKWYVGYRIAEKYMEVPNYMIDMIIPKHPRIKDVCYTREEAKLTVGFELANYKCIRVNIFAGKDIKRSNINRTIDWGAKLGFQGCYDKIAVEQIHEYLKFTFNKYYDLLIAPLIDE